MFTYTVVITVGGNSDASQAQQDECQAMIVKKIAELGVTQGDAHAEVASINLSA